MQLNLRNMVAALAAFVLFMMTLDRLAPFCSEVLDDQPLWQRFVVPLLPLLFGPLLAGGVFAVLSRESSPRASVFVSALVIMSPVVPAYMSYRAWPAWWSTLAWLFTVIAAIPGVVAVRTVQSWVGKCHAAT